MGTGAFADSKIGLYASHMMDSTFCINPAGDTPTRKGIFDALVLGCIPVITDSRSLEIYKWHIPNWTAVSVFIPRHRIMKSFHIVDHLINLEKHHFAEIQLK